VPKFLSQKVGAQQLGSIDFETGIMSAGEDAFTVMNATDITDAVVFALSRIGADPNSPEGGIPATLLGAPCLGINRVTVDDAGNYDVFMNYRVPTSGGSGPGDSISFSTTGGSAHVFNSLSSRARYPSTAPDHKGAINVTDSGVEGVDIDVARFDFSITRNYTFEEFSDAFVDTIRRLSNKVNNTTIFGALAGEIKFNGASGEKTASGGAITFNFSFQENKANFDVGGINVTLKKGWDLLWVQYEEKVDSGASPVSRVRRAKAVYIELVYEGADLRALGFT
jgi:hypothetical protein